MQLTKWILVGAAAALLTSPAFATTYYGGFEDTSGAGADYDYNDLIFNVTGTNLALHTATGVWFNRSSAGVLNAGAGAAGLAGTPFWNNSSLDGAGGKNVGWAIYGGGAINGGVGLAPADQYLATATGASVNDVFFSVDGNVTEQVVISITAATDSLGWQLASGGAIHLFAPGTQGPTPFTPGGDFVLIGNVGGGTNFASNAAAADGVSHFAFFGTAVPEPSSIGLLGFALLGSGLAFRKRMKSRS
jgi:PEP-CTERM motif-containing protein